MTVSQTTPLRPYWTARNRTILLTTLLVVMVLLAYAPIYVAGFIWDDPDYLLNNQTLRSLHGLWQIWTDPTSLPQWYPLVHTTFWLEYHLWGLNPVGYHIVNVVLQAAGAVLLWRLLAMLAIPGAWLAAALFAVHPVHVESVAWITERKNTLSALLYFAAAITYLRSRTNDGALRRDWYLISLVCFTAALFSKTVVCSLPAALLIMRWWKIGRITRSDWIPLLPMFAIGAVLAATTAWLERTHVRAVGPSWTFASTHAGEFAARTLIAGRALWFYAAKIALPWHLAFIYSRWHINTASPWEYVFPIAAVSLFASLWLLRHRLGRGPLAALLYFAITLFPALGYFNIYPMRYSFVADHFQHLASIGLTTLAAAGLSRFITQNARVGMTLSTILIMALMAITFNQCTVYANSETLWRDTLTKTPDSWMVYTNLGRVLAGQGRALEAVPYLETALRLAPDIEDTHENVGVGRVLQGRFAEAEAEFRSALLINPEFVTALTDLAKLEFFDLHKPAEAERYFGKALHQSPGFFPAEYAYAQMLQQQGNLIAAADHYQLAASAAPDDFDAQYNLGSVLLKLHRPGDAIAPLLAATQIQPTNRNAWINLHAAYLLDNQPDAAAAVATDALRALAPPIR